MEKRRLSTRGVFRGACRFGSDSLYTQDCSMPLSPPAPREPIHNRSVECRAYQREDGLWDIEGHMVDTKWYEYHSEKRGNVAAGTPVHDMWIRLTVDEVVGRVLDLLKIHREFSLKTDICYIGTRRDEKWTSKFEFFTKFYSKHPRGRKPYCQKQALRKITLKKK